ncbi:hypothetical protein SISSUDRAFT_1038397 [Sistotremastrum suecicum HHB10207 ss-3]|uniref:HRDC domain-containing protein n=1 Tax=Sistotremastrum suecicum HHB10207 ss-3 TaxID=1314776 RepID=A0A165WT31_9AGAM|nr:hypothetical protein SISSUDRAFT_1038397 [Sistotremastrum suecicum HHB10207 ss-3]
MSDALLSWVSTPEELAATFQQLRTVSEVAVDLKPHDCRTFSGFLYLMQISLRENDFVVDTLALRDELEISNGVFTDPTVVKYWVKIPTKKYKMADWRIRPLPNAILRYARSDTHFLLFVNDSMKTALLDRAEARPDLVLQVLERPKQYSLRRHGRGLTGPKLAGSKAVHGWRDQVAQKDDESTHHVMPNNDVFKPAEHPPADMAALMQILPSPSPPVRTRLKQLLELIRETVWGQLEQAQNAAKSDAVLNMVRVVPAMQSSALVESPGRNLWDSRDSTFSATASSLFGNIVRETLRQVWRSEHLDEFRQIVHNSIRLAPSVDNLKSGPLSLVVAQEVFLKKPSLYIGNGSGKNLHRHSPDKQMSDVRSVKWRRRRNQSWRLGFQQVQASNMATFQPLQKRTANCHRNIFSALNFVESRINFWDERERVGFPDRRSYPCSQPRRHSTPPTAEKPVTFAAQTVIDQSDVEHTAVEDDPRERSWTRKRCVPLWERTSAIFICLHDCPRNYPFDLVSDQRSERLEFSKLVYSTSIALFTAACIVGGLSKQIGLLIGMRIAQASE